MTDDKVKLPAVTLVARRGKIFADSRQVAQAFDRMHKNVLQTIRNLECSSEFRRINFQPFKIKDLTGESTSHVEMTRDGFMFLVMELSGPKAAVMKEAFISEFNRMEAALRNRRLAVREEGKKVRNNFTGTLRSHGCEKPDDFRRSTNAIYLGLWDLDAAGLRKKHSLPEKSNVRNSMCDVALGSVLLSEALAAEQISQKNLWGVDKCSDASLGCARSIRGAVAAVRSNKRIGAPTE